MGGHRAFPYAKALKVLLAGMLAVCMGVGFVGCSGSASSSQSAATSYKKNDTLAKSSESVHLTIVGSTATFKALEGTISSFHELYPNCTIEYEYVQDYWNNLTTRLKNNDNVDLFISSNIQSDSPYYPYSLDLLSESGKVDLSNTYGGLIKNFTVTSGNNDELYSVPFGGELRGMYVNTTLLDSLGLKVPTNYSEFMDCCKTLKAAGYIPVQGNPGSFGQQLMYPYICNLVANSDDYQATYSKVATCEPGVSELFREPMSRLYDIVQNGYYDYKTVETSHNAFMNGTEDTAARSFLNIVSDGNGGYKKADDKGQVAFMPQAMSLQSELGKMKDDYHSGIEYEFILAPTGDDGGYAYLSPSQGMAVNKNGSNVDWSLEFMNYLLSPSVNKAFAAERGIIPNTGDALDTIKSSFDVDSSHVSQLGQVSFSYVFFDVVNQPLTDVSKANNPKYMQADGTMYGLNHYMAEMESGFAKQRSTR